MLIKAQSICSLINALINYKIQYNEHSVIHMKLYNTTTTNKNL